MRHRATESVKDARQLQSESSPTPSLNQIEVDNQFLSHQNDQLNKELSLTRYTIEALKTIIFQKDSALQATRQELDRARLEINNLMNARRRPSGRDNERPLSGIMAKLPLRHGDTQQPSPPESPREIREIVTAPQESPV